MAYYKIQAEKVVEHFVSNCLKCGSDKIKIHEYEDQFGCISTATCNNCKNKIRVNKSEIGVIKEWNKQNDIPTLIKNKIKLISLTNKELKELLALEKERNKK